MYYKSIFIYLIIKIYLKQKMFAIFRTIIIHQYKYRRRPSSFITDFQQSWYWMFALTRKNIFKNLPSTQGRLLYFYTNWYFFYSNCWNHFSPQMQSKYLLSQVLPERSFPVLKGPCLFCVFSPTATKPWKKRELNWLCAHFFPNALGI